MLEKFLNIFKIPDLKKRIFFVLAMVLVFRIGVHIPLPGVNAKALKDLFAQGGILSFIDLFAGGALKRFSIFAMGIMPYINASIIMQLLIAVIPALERLSKEGDEGREKITSYIRYGTIVVGALQALGLTIWLENMGVLIVTGPLMRVMNVVSLTAGTTFLMWLGEQITDYGIGNGISIIIFAGIVARLPSQLVMTGRLVAAGEASIFALLALIIIAILSIAGVIMIELGERRIPVQYAKRVVGRRVYGGQATYLPLRVNQAGVIPIIFAIAVLMLPGTLAQFFQTSESMQNFNRLFSPGTPLYIIVYALLIIFFTYFYTAISFNPQNVAENMQKYGGFIPGIRPGKPTATYIEKILSRVTLPGAIFLAIVAILPTILMKLTNITTFYLGGTSLLIMVGVALETIRQIEAHLSMRHYEGFLKG